MWQNVIWLYLWYVLYLCMVSPYVLEGKVKGSRIQGRPRRSWMGEFVEWTNLKTYDRVKRTAGDRVSWKSMVVDLLMKMTNDWLIEVRIIVWHASMYLQCMYICVCKHVCMCGYASMYVSIVCMYIRTYVRYVCIHSKALFNP